MLRTFSIRRKEVVTISPAVSVFKERWPGLFCKAQVLVEFRRITTISLEETFMLNLDRYTPRLLQLMLARGGTSGTRICPLLNTINEVQSIEKKRDILVCCLIEYLGENHEELFQDCQELERQTNQAMKVMVMHNPTAEQDPVIEGNKVLSGCGNRTTACMLLMGFIYALNLEYPRNLKYSFDVFQKLFLELDGTNPLKKVQTLKRKLME
ncbi:hypothetical protein E1301_Tti021883 [Triplophysa tibetana]|uniref:Uncharacterized protein n=1 Tax=Triplophysa tibetana TaxID=1572043 RepID=A0A5A9PHL1_9TELE|nr:hypothetical protein E1301_Tti021883 [Triplophysa tibetana]